MEVAPADIDKARRLLLELNKDLLEVAESFEAAAVDYRERYYSAARGSRGYDQGAWDAWSSAAARLRRVLA